MTASSSPRQPASAVMRAFKWSGGAAFVISLTLTGYVVTRWWPLAPARPADEVLAACAWNGCLFSLFAAHHSLLARAGMKQRLETILPPLAQRSFYVWCASVLLLVCVLGWRPIGRELWALAGTARAVGWSLQVAGLILVWQAARIVDPLELAGIREATAGHLESRGPYLFVRHPIYLGLLLVVWGTPTMTGDRLWFATLITAYLRLAIPWEEASLRRSIGAAYDDYCARVRWRVIPGVF